MATEKLLNKSQAVAVYAAMCALNNVNAKAEVAIKDDKHGFIRVIESLGGRIQVNLSVTRGLRQFAPDEEYRSQAEFAAAYGLN